jgi:hypothetical protein
MLVLSPRQHPKVAQHRLMLEKCTACCHRAFQVIVPAACTLPVLIAFFQSKTSCYACLTCCANERTRVVMVWGPSTCQINGDTRHAGNILLLLVKLYAFLASRSFAVLASLADSGVDLASQIVLWFCNRRAQLCQA